MEEVVGRNPRFMQDSQSDLGAVEEMGSAVREGRATVVEVINQRKDGSRFWNQVGSSAGSIVSTCTPACHSRSSVVCALCLVRGGTDLHAFI